MTTDSQSPAEATTIRLPGFGLPLSARTRLDSFRSGGRFPMALDNDEDLPYEYVQEKVKASGYVL